MSNKPLKDLSLLDRFLFNESMEDYFIHKSILEIILGEKINLLTSAQTEKEFRTSPLLKSIRVDTYSIDDMARIFNSEAQKRDSHNLPKRSRFYNALIDSSLLPVGNTDYNALNELFMIMITPFDLFGYGKYQYTFRMKCEEVDGLHLGNDVTYLYLNTRGTDPTDVSSDLVNLLHYMEHTTEETARNAGPAIQEIHKRVEVIKHSEEVGVRYMQAWEEKIFDREEARKEGLAEGRAEGMAQGRAEGMAQGRAEGIFAIIKDNLNQNISKASILLKLEQFFTLTSEEAENYYQEYINNQN